VALTRSLTISQRAGVANVVMPPIGVRLDDHGNNALSLSTFFKTFFSAVPVADHPDSIYLSLHKSWPSFELEAAIQALNAAWQQAVSDKDGDYVLYRRDIRMVLAALLICLLACGFRVTYSLKNFLIITLTFVGFGIGANKWVEPLATEQSPNVQLLVQIIILIALAAAFPIIVTWNPKDVFGKDGA
jgi:hypothetical protein